MKKRINRVLRIILRILGGLFILILTVILAFYLGRGTILRKAVDHLNSGQPGEIQVGQINLIPFMDFPDVALQLGNVNLFEHKVKPGGLYQEPVLYLDDIFVSLDVADLVRGDIRVSRARFRNGFIRVEMAEDSLTNLEKALGLRFTSEEKEDTTGIMPQVRVDLDRIELENIRAFYEDRVNGDGLQLKIVQMASSFNYLPEQIRAAVDLEMEIDQFSHLTYSSDTRRELKLVSEISVKPPDRVLELSPSTLRVSGMDLEMWGTLVYAGERAVDLFFRARHTGLDLLNFMLKGILDLDEIEQTEGGRIYLNGSVNGKLGKQLPVLRINGSADGVGFRIRSIGKEVTGISFRMYATNGTSPDMSEAMVAIEDFRAGFPEGELNISGTVRNLVFPEVDIQAEGGVELRGLEKMVRNAPVRDLEGNLSLAGRVSGKIDPDNGIFEEDTSDIRVHLGKVGFTVNDRRYRDVSGNLYLRDMVLGADSISAGYLGNRVLLSGRAEHVPEYLMNLESEVKAELSVSSDYLRISDFITDTAILKYTGDDHRDIGIYAAVKMDGSEIDTFLQTGRVPEMDLTMVSPGFRIPGYPKISEIRLETSIYRDSITLSRLAGILGESDLEISGKASNYGTVMKSDSTRTPKERTEMAGISYRIRSGLLRARDLPMDSGGPPLPVPFMEEELREFSLSGDLQFPVTAFDSGGGVPDLSLRINDMGWSMKYHPLPFRHFRLGARTTGNAIFIDTLTGEMGENNVHISAVLRGLADTSGNNLSGHLSLSSGMLNLNSLMDYKLPGLADKSLEVEHASAQEASGQAGEAEEPALLGSYEYPDFELDLDVDHLVYGAYALEKFQGKIRSTREKILYFDKLSTSTESGGFIDFSGQFNVSNPVSYTLSAEFDIQDMDVNDLDFEMKSGDSIYTLKENFKGLVSASGLAEVFFTPDLKPDLSPTTAVFNFRVEEGAMINFTPLQAAEPYLEGRDMNNVRFATLRNSFPLTLADGKINIPLTIVESTLGQMLIEGEQGLDNSFLYLMRLPTWLVRDAAGSVLTNREEGGDEGQIYQMRTGKFLMLTVYSDGKEVEVKTGDRRDRYKP